MDRDLTPPYGTRLVCPGHGLVPMEGIEAAQRAMRAGSLKYGGHVVKKTTSQHAAALLRHLSRWLDDPAGVDVESGLGHLDHVAARALLLVLENECVF